MSFSFLGPSRSVEASCYLWGVYNLLCRKTADMFQHWTDPVGTPKYDPPQCMLQYWFPCAWILLNFVLEFSPKNQFGSRSVSKHNSIHCRVESPAKQRQDGTCPLGENISIDLCFAKYHVSSFMFKHIPLFVAGPLHCQKNSIGIQTFSGSIDSGWWMCSVVAVVFLQKRADDSGGQFIVIVIELRFVEFILVLISPQLPNKIKDFVRMATKGWFTPA